MKVKVERRWPKVTYTIGRLYIDGIYYCNTLEDHDRGLKQSDPLPTIQKRKVAGETAIPKGVYEVTMNVTSPKYAAVAWYYNFCRGKMPRLKDVPGFDGSIPGRTHSTPGAASSSARTPRSGSSRTAAPASRRSTSR